MTLTQTARRPRRAQSQKTAAVGATRITHHVTSHVVVHQAKAKPAKVKTSRRRPRH